MRVNAMFWRRLSRRGKMMCAAVGGLFAGLLLFALWWEAPPEVVYLERLGTVPVVNDILPEEYVGRTEQKRPIRYLVIHETGNINEGANAQAHNAYLHNEKQREIPLSWHYTVDDSQVYHHLPDDETAYHAGERNGNRYGIGIEICVNCDGDYEQAVENAALLCASLLEAYELTIEDVKQHYDFSGKNCPQQMREQGQWQNFLNLVEEYR